jgi:hypothetical protein
MVNPEPLSTISISASRLDVAPLGANGSARMSTLPTLSPDKPQTLRRPLGRLGASPHQSGLHRLSDKIRQILQLDRQVHIVNHHVRRHLQN